MSAGITFPSRLYSHEKAARESKSKRGVWIQGVGAGQSSPEHEIHSGTNHEILAFFAPLPTLGPFIKEDGQVDH